VTSSPYVPSGGQDQDPQTSEWSAGSDQPVADPAAPYGQFDEPVTTGYTSTGSTATGGDVYGESSSSSSTTKDAAKGEAADLKNTAVDRGQQVAGVAKEQAGAVKDTAVDRGQQVVGTAKEEASRVTAEATGQARDLLQQGRQQLSEQVSTQQQKLGSLVHSLADELGTMAAKSDKSGPLTDLAQQGSRRIGALAHQLETGEASDLLDQVRTFARRRPVAFLVGSALAGVVVGRLSRSLAAEAHDNKVANELPASSYSTSGTDYDTGYTTGAYTTGTTTTGGYSTGTAAAGGYAAGTTTGGYESGSYDTGYPATRAYEEETVYVEPGQGDLPR
jgi:hypothetical protein